MGKKKLVSDAHFGIGCYFDFIKKRVVRAVQKGFGEAGSRFWGTNTNKTSWIKHTVEGERPDWVEAALKQQIKKRLQQPRAKEVFMKTLDEIWNKAIEDNPSTKGDV
jgi:basic membrane lipoprotein Med (substrate-binding protein (PBP1-ABC) superfamily)